MYTNLPVESLKTFADAGDKDAMLFYGIEMMQTSAIGLSTLKRAELERRHRMKGGERARKAHESSVEQFNNGVEYAYKAAVNGKLAAFMEVELYFGQTNAWAFLGARKSLLYFIQKLLL